MEFYTLNNPTDTILPICRKTVGYDRIEKQWYLTSRFLGVEEDILVDRFYDKKLSSVDIVKKEETLYFPVTVCIKNELIDRKDKNDLNLFLSFLDQSLLEWN